jgi:hypothetical protein
MKTAVKFEIPNDRKKGNTVGNKGHDVIVMVGTEEFGFDSDGCVMVIS